MRYLIPDRAGPGPTETAVIVPVPEADPLVGRWRHRLDPAESWGVPAHLTVLYPFVEPAAVDEGVSTALASAIAHVGAFECWFRRTRWFGDDVLWLEPDVTEPFRLLTHAVTSAFPGFPPYGGAHADVVPHLTVGSPPLGDRALLLTAERDVRSGLPLRTCLDRVLLIAGTNAPGSWSVVQEFSLHPTPRGAGIAGAAAG